MESLHRLTRILETAEDTLGSTTFAGFWRSFVVFQRSREPQEEQHQIILDSFPQLQFLPIGDSGERDPEIYREVVKEYPTRICAVYIRSINKDPNRLGAIDKLIEEIRLTGCQLVVAPDSELAVAHAAAALAEFELSDATVLTARSLPLAILGCVNVDT